MGGTEAPRGAAGPSGGLRVLSDRAGLLAMCSPQNFSRPPVQPESPAPRAEGARRGPGWEMAPAAGVLPMGEAGPAPALQLRRLHREEEGSSRVPRSCTLQGAHQLCPSRSLFQGCCRALCPGLGMEV